jgi:hypothetical protein
VLCWCGQKGRRSATLVGFLHKPNSSQGSSRPFINLCCPVSAPTGYKANDKAAPTDAEKTYKLAALPQVCVASPLPCVCSLPSHPTHTHVFCRAPCTARIHPSTHTLTNPVFHTLTQPAIHRCSWSTSWTMPLELTTAPASCTTACASAPSCASSPPGSATAAQTGGTRATGWCQRSPTTGAMLQVGSLS